MNMLKMCLNWKVLAGLAAVGVAVYVVAPNAMVGILPVLLLLACPLSMVVMMVGMQGMGARQGKQDTTQIQSASPLSREQQLAQLRTQLIGLGDQQVALARQIEQLEAADSKVRSPGSIEEGELVAHATGAPR